MISRQTRISLTHQREMVTWCSMPAQSKNIIKTVQELTNKSSHVSAQIQTLLELAASREFTYTTESDL